MKPLLFSALLLGASGVAAQGWFPDSAVWHYHYNSLFGEEGFVRIEVAGDTTVGGQSCRKLVRTRETYDHIGGQYRTHPLGRVFVYEADGLVMAHAPTPGMFDTLYHMAAVPGDRWKLARLPEFLACDPESRMIVTDTGTTPVGGVFLRWLAVEIHWTASWGTTTHRDTIIERIGTTRFYLLPHDFCNGFVDGHEGGGFRCYSDPGTSFTVTPGIPCDSIVSGMAEHAMGHSLRIWPSPGSERFTVGWDAVRHGPAQLELRDAQGRLVRIVRVASSSHTVETTDLPAGLYLLRLTHAQGAHAAKWTKE